MLLVIHNLPFTTRYADVKTLIKEKCGLTEMIVDNLVNEGKAKRVTVGLPDEGDAALLESKLHMSYVGNNQLHVEKMRNKTSSEYMQPNTQPCAQPQFPKFGNQPFQNQTQPHQNPQFSQMSMPMMSMMQAQPQMPVTNTPASNFGMPFYMTTQTPKVGSGYPLMNQFSNQPNQQVRPGSLGRNDDFAQRYKDRSSGRRSRSRERSPHRRSSRWESDNRSSSRGRERTPPRDRDRYSPDRFNERASYQSRSQNYGSRRGDDNRYETSSNRPNLNNERNSRFSGSAPITFSNNPGNSTFNISSDTSYRNNRYDQDKGTSGRRDDYYSPTRDTGNDISLRNNSPYKRSNDRKSSFEPPSKILAGNQHANFKNKLGFSGNSFSSNQPRQQQPKNLMFSNTRPMEPKQLQFSNSRFQQQNNRPQQPFQNNRPQQPNQPPRFQNSRSQPPNQQPRVPNSGPQQQNQHPRFPTFRPQQPAVPNSRPPQSNYRAVQPPYRPNLQQNYEPKGGSARPGTPNAATESTQPSTNTSHLKDLITKHHGWRSQAASSLANQIYTNLRLQKGGHKKNPVFIQLKASIRSRLDVITGDDLSMRPNVMMEKYRKTFKVEDDAVLYKAVLQKVDQSQRDGYEAEAVKAAEEVNITPDVDASKAPEKPIHEVKVEPDGERLPKHPFGNKAVDVLRQNLQKQEIVNDSMYVLPPLVDEALREELDKICDIYRGEIQNPEDRHEKIILKHMEKLAIPEFRRVLNLAIKKRILDVRTNLSVRIYCHPKYPNRGKLDTFLKTYGVICLKKSETKKNMYIATCLSYEDFDKLCALDIVKLDDTELSFRPLHITGPPVKNNKKKKKKGAGVEVKDDIEFEVNEEFLDEDSNDMDDEDSQEKKDIDKSAENEPKCEEKEPKCLENEPKCEENEPKCEENEPNLNTDGVTDDSSQSYEKPEPSELKKEIKDDYGENDFASDDFDFTADVEFSQKVVQEKDDNTVSQTDNNPDIGIEDNANIAEDDLEDF